MSEIVERYINERVEERVEERVKECVEERVKECVEERVKERVEKEKTILVQNLMNNMKWTLDQALDALGIKGKEEHLSPSSYKNNKALRRKRLQKRESLFFIAKSVFHTTSPILPQNCCQNRHRVII